MTINATDVQLRASQVMDDVPEGGGAPTDVIILDNSSNGIFNDISELDRAGGRVNLRKVFPSILSPNVDGYFGANFIVGDPPDDPKVSVTLFTTGDTFDTRTQAKARIESYLAQGPIYGGYLYGDHIAGQGAVTLLQRVEAPLPVNGDTLVLRKNEGLTTQAEQYVRVTKVTAMQRTFTDVTGDFTRMQVTLLISDILRDDYPGFDAIRVDSAINYTNKTKTYTTIVADAARYYGIVPLTDPVAIGDVVVNATDIFTQLVPSTRVETPIADARMNQQSSALVEAGAPLVQNYTLAFTNTQALFVGGGILPGSLSVVRAGITVTDKGGVLISNGSQCGIVDYDNGILTLSVNVFGTSSGTHVVTYKPAVGPVFVSESVGIPVTQEGQRLTWVVPIAPIPAKASLQISYRTLNRWYVLTEDGSGAIRGSDSSLGAGTLNYTTGTVTLTLGALPDIGSQIIFEWAPAVASQSITALADVGVGVTFFGALLQIPNAIKPGTLTITWTESGSKSSTDVGGGSLTGDANGNVDYAGGKIMFQPKKLPAVGAAISVSIINATQAFSHFPTMVDNGSTWKFTLPTMVRAGSVKIGVVGTLQMRSYPGKDADFYQYFAVIDDGAGNLKMFDYKGLTGTVIGTVDYGTGICLVNKSVPTGYLSYQPTFETTTLDSAEGVTKISQTGYEDRAVAVTLLNTVDASVKLPDFAWWTGTANVAEVNYASTDGTTQVYPFTFDTAFLGVFGLEVRNFSLDAHNYIFDNASATYMVDPSPTTGIGTKVGSKSVVGGQSGILLTAWATSVSGTPITISGASSPKVTGMLAESISFRTAIAPLFNGGFTVLWDDAHGASHSATPDSSGIINTTEVVGRVDYQTGVATLRFGTHGSAPDATTQDVSYLNIPGITNVNPVGISADSLRYNAVGYSYLPLDATILGLDPVRLPADGRVPIFRAGSYAVIGNTGKVGPATVTNGQVINCGRVRLSRVRVVGHDNLIINSGYTVDLDAGLVTFVDVTGYSQPVTIEHRIEDMGVVSDAQISGQITFTSQITHAYPTLDSYISSALLAGDMHARMSLTFDQATWTNVWSDDVIGVPATGTFNTIGNPLQITNEGGLTERWACIFTNTTAFNIVGEHVGVIATGNTSTNAAPNNPATGHPYFTIPALGWGLGWSVGNVFRFNTVGAEYPVWAIRTIQPGPAAGDGDSFQLLIRGDVNKP